MPSTRCPQCGNEIPENSNFCNKCGKRLILSTITNCPNCHQDIPGNSVFCPKCGKMIRNDVPSPTTPKTAPISTPKPSPAPKANVEEADDDDYSEKPSLKPQESHTARNWAISMSLVLMIGALVFLIMFGDSLSSKSEVATDSVAVAQKLTPEEALNTFINTIAKENKNGDGAISAYASYTDVAGRERIVGINYLSSSTQRSFFKIFTLERIDGDWKCISDISRFADGGGITFDRSSLKFVDDNVPQITEIDGKLYFYFVYLNSPIDSGDNASPSHLMFCLYNIDSQDIVSLDFECKPLMRDNDRLLQGKATESRNTPEFKFLQDEMNNARIIYKPSPEELAMESPKNAIKKWRLDNNDKIDEMLTTVGGVKLSITRYDKPIFDKDNINTSSRIENEGHIYLTSKQGTVYGYNRRTKQYFVVYSGSGASTPAIELNADGTLHITTATVNFNFDPTIDEASPAE